MGGIDNDLIDHFSLSEICKVTFYKRDEVTTDPIYCDVVIADIVWRFHEEMRGWDLLINHLQALPNFRLDWSASVSQPPFESSETVAFCRQI